MAIHGSQTDEYEIYLYAKVENDYRPTENSEPHHLWSIVDFGSISIDSYLKVMDAMKTMFQERGIDKYSILSPQRTLYGYKKYIYYTKYGAEVPLDLQNTLLPIHVANPGNVVDTATELAIVIWSHVSTSNPAHSIIYPQTQSGAMVPPNISNNESNNESNMAGGRRRRHTRRGRSATRRRRASRRHRRSA